MTHRLALCLLLALVGCTSGGDDGPPETDTPVDSDTEPTVDSDDSDPPDESDPPAGSEVRVRVLAVGSGDPVQFADVFSSDADGAPVATAVTDASGEALLFVPEGGSVSFVERLGDGRTLDTAYDVPEGGVVVFQSSAFVRSGDGSGSWRPWKVTATGSPAGADLWTVHTSCGGFNALSPTLVEVDNSGCPGRTVQDLLVIASDGGVPVAWGTLADVDVSEGDEVFVVPVTAAAPRTFEVGIVDAPSGVTAARLYAELEIDGDADPSPASEPVGGFDGSVKRTLTLPGIPGGAVRLIATVELGARTKSAELRSAEPSPTLEFDASRLAEASTQVRAEGERPSVSWVVTPGDRGDGGRLLVAYDAVESLTATWEVRFDPAARNEVRMPRLPEAHAGFQGRADGDATLTGLWLYEHSWVDDYADYLLAEPPPAESLLQYSGGG